ncbi:hypothetical protein BXA19_02450 [Corynebacterium diphtheriae]|nr:hypothetical protein BUE67_02170 [Corynebacterium diphtheriae]OLO15323.1 hypothetical protein BUV99_00500 [Corynebacterium diphtheriae]OLO23875.1 hypothetical protein BVH76_00500 [Corynebacterium diphtheriae]OLO24652.1 hypothetical protein BVH78_02185 [Corynebacterium diphtheriae]OMO44746.1 hypothetical protein BVL41_02155 [Corynebacterium diphtheriae]
MNGISIAVVVTLSSSMLSILIGVLVGMQFKLTPTQTASIGIATGTANLGRFWNFRDCGTTCCAKCRGRWDSCVQKITLLILNKST